MYQVKQEKFEGPLDLLLDLIQKQKLSVNEISLARVTDEFVTFLNTLRNDGRADPEILAEFLVVASQLLLIKSRSLLPQFQVSAEEEASIHELEERLAAYQKIKGLARAFGELSEGGQKSFSREAHLNREVHFLPPKRLTSAIVEQAFRKLLETIPKAQKLIQEKIKRVISLEEKIKELQALLQGKVEQAFSQIVSGAKERVEVIVSFLALLELMKQKLVSVNQQELFADIHVRQNK